MFKANRIESAAGLNTAADASKGEQVTRIRIHPADGGCGAPPTWDELSQAQRVAYAVRIERLTARSGASVAGEFESEFPPHGKPSSMSGMSSHPPPKRRGHHAGTHHKVQRKGRSPSGRPQW